MSLPVEIVAEYTAILDAYLRESTEAHLFKAYQFSRRCVDLAIGPEELLGLHMEAIERLTRQSPLKPSHLIISHNLLLEAMMAYGIFYREYLDLQKRHVETLTEKKIESDRMRLEVEALNLQLEAKVQRQITELQAAREKLYRAEKLSSLGQMVAGLAHEVNNPLTGVLGFSELLRDRKDIDLSIRIDLDKIYREATRAKDIIQHLLAFSRQQRLTKSLYNINDILQSALTLREHDHRVNNISVETELDPRLPWTLVDATQIQEVFLNILLNGAQSMQEAHGRGTFLIRTRRVAGEELWPSNDRGCAVPERIHVVIANDGPAIPPESLPHLFEPFFTTRDVGEGTGLGLSVAYGFVQEHGGEIQAVCPPDGGVVFTVDLPVVAGAVCTEEESVPAVVPLAGKRILVVEDEPVLLDLIREVLTGKGCRVDVARSGEAALDQLEENCYDLILSDVRMPGLGGAGLCRQMDARQPRLVDRLIFITGDTVNPETRVFLKEGKYRFIEKPFHIVTLIQVMEEALGGGSRSHATGFP
jgi:signal transduction histidine kinase/ActR/RegA family two-component response regulator